MLVITLGTQASASTWVFNVVRQLLFKHHPNSFSGYAEEGAEAIRMLKPEAEYSLFKAHSLDAAMIGLASATHGRIIVTSRDPRDVLVSQAERFNEDFQIAARTLTKSLATIASLPPRLQTLHLRYEDDFTKNPETVSRIANFIDINASAEECDEIVRSMDSDLVNSRIADWINQNPDRGAHDWNRTTEWHPGHLGDGVIGKWTTRLPKAAAKAATGALLPFDPGQDWRNAQVTWMPPLFTNNGEAGRTEFRLDNTAGMLVWGPYLMLPVGRWQITPLLTADAATPLTVAVDLFSVGSEQGLLELKTVTVPLASASRMAFEIDVLDHTRPIELRISTLKGGGAGKLGFKGARIKYLGASFAAMQSPRIESSF